MDRYLDLEKVPVDERIKNFMSTPVSNVEDLKKGGVLQRMELLCLQIQADFCGHVERLEKLEGSDVTVQVDRWSRPDHGGGGITCVLQDGKVFEKSGVGISVVKSMLNPKMQAVMRSRGHKLAPPKEGDALPFSVVGVSCVVHPTNPHSPTVHFNYRYFEVETADGIEAWFGGGTDMTPNYIYEEDIKSFHMAQKNACDRSGPKVYPKLKKWCDEYFVNTHRGPSGECRGVGGIFFDDVDGDFAEVGKPDYEAGYRHQVSCGSSICDSIFPIFEKRMKQEFTVEEKEWQQIRRGRYVEFNLVHDRGTKFGFATPGARIEAVLMSMPLTARWQYDHHPKEGTKEHEAVMVFQNPRDWTNVQVQIGESTL